MSDYDSIDLEFTWDGDYAIDDDGDIRDTSYDYLQSIRNEVANIVRSELLDWEREPTIGANLSDFLGEPNTREMGQLIQDRVKTALIAAGIVLSEDVSVRVIPVGVYKVMIAISILAIATTNNQLDISDPIVVSTIFDSTEQGLFVLPWGQTEFDFA